MLLIEFLHDVQRLFGGIAEKLVGVALQFGQVIQAWCIGFFRFAVDRNNRSLLLLQLFDDGCDLVALETLRVVRFFILPNQLQLRICLGLDAVICLRLEFFDFLFASGDDGDDRCLDAAAVQLGVEFRRQRAGRIQADVPIRFRTGHSRLVQVFIVLARLQVLEAVFDGLVRHGRDPQAFDGFIDFRFFDDPTGYQFALAAGIRRDDDVGNVIAHQLGLDGIELLAGLLDDSQLQILRKHRQISQIPIFIFHIIGFRIGQRHKMPQGPSDDIVFPFQVPLTLFLALQHAGDIARHRWFFS